jgi:hypothetical protein
MGSKVAITNGTNPLKRDMIIWPTNQLGCVRPSSWMYEVLTALSGIMLILVGRDFHKKDTTNNNLEQVQSIIYRC